ncbi:hypothetical protein FSP39_002523 [Pinctada imbricata]|uniref:CHAT domain-containing protein n=1 Tax=Pinctada imbricata TaxID=66713 RepID=A0AA88Y128_PINIB|nr:hypothetical protein FSP39_002523 [Pinctada imbricata]
MTERTPHFSGPGGGLSHSFSMASLADGSEPPISEAEEINEMKSLREMGDRAMQIHDYQDAIRHYNEALEIDENSTDILRARAMAFIEMGEYRNAQKDAEYLVSLEPDNAQSYKIQGIALEKLEQYIKALDAYITALDLDPDNSDLITNHIAVLCAKFCDIPYSVLDRIKEMDPYKKLSEVGVNLFQAKKYDICIKVLETSQKFQTNQKGIVMRVLLTLANAHSVMKHNEEAINLYQECLGTAVATHEQVYQTKSLVNIATLYLEMGNTHQALVFYEKLLHLEGELREETGENGDLPDFWTKELQCGLRLNLSIAYKTIGSMMYAERYARQYVKLIEMFNLEGHIRSESYHNIGMLNEILGNFKEALNNYTMYLKVSKKNRDKKGVAQAYGCVGSIYAAFRNWKLSITYHEQSIAVAKTTEDSKLILIANEMLADTYMVKEEYGKAVDYYKAMLQACIRSDYRARSMAMCKLGNAYREMKDNQKSVAYYQQACNFAEDFDYLDILTMCQYSIGCIYQHSDNMMNLEQARKYFEKLVPFFESKIREHEDEDTYCPEEYYNQLEDCYDGMQSVLSKLGNKEECLEIAEAYRKRSLTQIPGYPSSFVYHGSQSERWNVDRMCRVVDQQNALVLYYSVVGTRALVWIISPGKGLMRFYAGKTPDGTPMSQMLQSYIAEMRSSPDWGNMQNNCENRSLPPKNLDLTYIRRKNLKLAKAENTNNNSVNEENDSLKSARKILFNLLLAPVEDILMKIELNSHVIIIPDKELTHCPFSALQDWNGRHLSDRFHVTILPSLLALEKVVNNELNQLKTHDDINFERSQSRRGGLEKVMAKVVMTNASSPSGESDDSYNDVDLRKVSNPRLMTSRQGRTSTNFTRGFFSPGENNMADELDQMISPMSNGIISPSKNIPPVKSYNTAALYRSIVGSPSPVEKMLHVHTYSTLTTRTSTGTDITSSTQCIPSYQQISSKEKCLVFGNPHFPKSLMLHGSEWKPNVNDMPSAKRELQSVASYLSTDVLSRQDATKDRFIEEAPKATVIHLATYGCWKEGLIACTPNSDSTTENLPLPSSYVITASDILSLKLTAQVVVLSMGYGPNRINEYIDNMYRLPSAFLEAGVQCVLTCMWPVPDLAVEKFYFHFYHKLQTGAMVTDAIRVGVRKVREDDRFKDPYFWSGWILVGKDIHVNVCQIRHSLLDQKLDNMEKAVEENSGKNFLNPKTSLTTVPSREENLESLQKILGQLLHHHTSQPSVVPSLIDLLDSSLKRLHTEENNRQTSILPMAIVQSRGGLNLLRHLGFHFQAKGAMVDSPYVVYPHWNNDDLLIPIFDALRAVLEVSLDGESTQSVYEMLPLSQDHISQAVDLLCITKHAADIQLKTTDLSVRPLWQNIKIRRMLTAVGFHQIGLLLNFNKTPEKKRLLNATLQLLLSVSAYKSQILLYRLDVNLLGKPSVSKASFHTDTGKLPTLAPIILPRNQLRMSTPWLSRAEKADEMDEKVQLARSKSDLDDKFKGHLDRAKTWHQVTVAAQANESLDKYGRPKSTPPKVKVIGGSTASRNRIPIKREPLLVIPEVDQRRDYANFVLQQRIENIDVRHKNEIMKLYLPYIQGAHN